LHHPELHKMAPGLGLLRPEGRPEAIYLAECRGGRFVVKLAALGQIGLFAEIIGFEQRRRPLAGVRGEDGRVDQEEPAVIEKTAADADDLVTDAQDRLLAV